ncbi:ImcF-related family protein [Paraburkholderia sp. SIMBA_030]|uniref:ImcF-related family protein n=1 Tax=Paraburkholderia sp. SIMBA_030 TaxID=3085773 RepID=UPI00397826C6
MVKPVVHNTQAPHMRGASFVVFALVLLIVLGLLTWIAARQYEWSDARLLGIELALVMAVFALIGGFVLSGRGTRDALQGAGLSGQNELGTGTASAGAVTLKELARTLYLRHGLFWRYRESWLLLVGNAPAVAAHMPGLATQDWHVTGDTVLLHCPADQNGLPDRTWLRRLARLRWRRPLDAIVWLTDPLGDELAAQRSAVAAKATLTEIAIGLRWSAPLHVVTATDLAAVEGDGEEPIGCTLPRRYDDRAVSNALQSLGERLAIDGTRIVARDRRRRYLAELSQRLETWRAPLTRFGVILAQSRHVPVEPRGAWFLPARSQMPSTPEGEFVAPLIWQRIGSLGRRSGGRRVGWHSSTVGATIMTVCACLWIGGMAVSAGANTRDQLFAKTVVQGAATARDDHAGLRALLDLQHEIERFEYRATDGAPWYSRFGLNRDAMILKGLWQAYSPASRRLLVTPTQQGLENALATVAAMRTDVADPATTQQAVQGHKTLKTYLMMAEPQRADAKLMEPEMTRNWLTHAALTLGERQDLAHQFFPFFAQHLPTHPAWAIQPRADLVNGTRQTLLAITGVKNSTDTLYHSILDAAAGKYGDQTLATMLAGTDARGLFHTSATVPGVYTRQAFDGQIAQAIDDAAARQDVSTDWTLGATSSVQPRVESADVLRKELRQMYFDDYAQHWQAFANSIQWESAPTLPAVAEQLRLFADARQSPLIALMKTLDYQGRAGENVQSLSDTLVAKAQGLIGKHEYAGQVEGEIKAMMPAAPLDAAFGPVLRLVGPAQAQGGVASSVSMSGYLNAVTTLRLKLEAMTNSGSMNDQAKQVAQSLFQGRNSDLSDTRSYASLIAASLGEQWSGLGASLFLRPVDQAMQAVLQPAQASLNDAWRQSVVEPWARSFQGRYPFASSGDDASFPELVRFIRDQTGLIPAFINQQLAGALELHGDQWVPGSAGAQGIRFDPTFLRNLNVLQGIASHLLASGAAQYRFDLMAQPTGDVTETLLTIDGQKLKYFNQADHWQPFVWPGNDLLVTGTRLEWQTVQSGLNRSFERDGRWAFIRMLESAHVEPLSDARFRLTWSATPGSSGAAPPSAGTAAVPVPASDPDSLLPGTPLAPLPKTFTHPITYVMRTDAGKGPLELLALRGFTMPPRIFAPAPAPAAMKSAGPPPLPASAVAAARHASVPLPHGTIPYVE